MQRFQNQRQSDVTYLPTYLPVRRVYSIYYRLDYTHRESIEVRVIITGCIRFHCQVTKPNLKHES